MARLVDDLEGQDKVRNERYPSPSVSSNTISKAELFESGVNDNYGSWRVQRA